MEFAVTVIGRDRVGIVADVAGHLAALGANLTDSTMTILRGHFAMTLICTAPAAAEQLRQALTPVSDSGLLVSVSEVEADGSASSGGSSYVVSVHGADRLGIVAAVARAIAGAGGNITDLSTRLTGTLYVLVAEVDLPAGVADALAKALMELATALHVEVNLRPAEADLL
ncbi:MAG TPA: ACT domain-containing protein [Candidatus Limnocylindrales bacterium]